MTRSSSSASEPGAALHCAAHPNTTTYLRCAQCGTPICPRCLVMTPVGAKCKSCARVRLQAGFILRPIDVVVVAAVAIVAGLGVGLLGSLVVGMVPFATILFPFVAGLAVSEAIDRLAGRKRHLVLKVLAGLGVVVSFVALLLGTFILRDPLALGNSAVLAPLIVNLLAGVVINPILAITLILGIWVAVYRL